jgi:ubiquinone/menaquinone biosynthesis C-methylase UbiE
MADSYSSKLQLWEGWTPSLMKSSSSASPVERPLPVYKHRLEFADRVFVEEALSANGRLAEGAEPFTLQWFLEIENARYRRQGGWIPRLLEFSKHKGETLLGVGHGLGTDWVQYARQGAEVIACCPSAEQLALIQRNFALRGLKGVFLHANARAMPVDSASIDVVCLAQLLERSEDPRGVINEVYRVLKPGGKVLSMIPSRYDIEYWRDRLFPWHSWFRPRQEFKAEILTFSSRSLRQLFGRFVEGRVFKRHLRRAEIPPVWRWLPQPLVERLLGHYLIIKAFKPLSAANLMPLAA